MFWREIKSINGGQVRAYLDQLTRLNPKTRTKDTKNQNQKEKQKILTMASASSGSSGSGGLGGPPAATLTSEALKAPAAMIDDSKDDANDGDHDEITKLKLSLQREKAAKRKMYSYLVKIADELKVLREESDNLRRNASDYSRGKAWYEGGMWRGPNVLPSATAAPTVNSPSIQLNKRGVSGEQQQQQQEQHGDDGYSRVSTMDYQGGGTAAAAGGGEGVANTCVPRAPVSLSDLFLDMVSK
jgi:hypothetical protein